MQVVIADTGPINYLILIAHIEILPALFSTIILSYAMQLKSTPLGDLASRIISANEFRARASLGITGDYRKLRCEPEPE